MVSWLIPYKRLRWAVAGSRGQFLDRLDEVAVVERRDSSFVVSRRSHGRNPYRPYLHLRLAERDGSLTIAGWMAPSEIGIAGLAALGVFMWATRVLPNLAVAATATLLVHVAFSTVGYVAESIQLEADVSAVAFETTNATLDQMTTPSNNKMQQTSHG
jgi:hypothetical protein